MKALRQILYAKKHSLNILLPDDFGATKLEVIVLPVEETIILKAIKLRKKFKLKLPDAIIGATALVNGLALVTRDTKDFDKIESWRLYTHMAYRITPEPI